MSSDNTQPDVPERTVRVHRLTTLFVWAVVLVLVLQFFPAAKILVLGVLAAGCLASAMRPVMRRVPGPRVLRGVVAGLIPAVLCAAFLFGVGWAMKGPVKREMGNWPQIKERMNTFLADWSQRLGADTAPNVDSMLENVRGFLVDSQVISTTTNLLTAVLLSLAFIFFGSIFILIEKEKCFLASVQKLLPRRRRPQLAAAVEDIEPKLRWWVIGTLISMTVIGVLSGIGYTIVGLEFAIPLALIAGFAEIVPTIGPTLSFLIALVFGLAQGPSTALGVAGVWAVVQTIESNVLLPYVMKKSVKIPPVVTLFTVVLWGKIFGAAGLFLAIPLNLVVWTAMQHFVAENGNADQDGAAATEDPSCETGDSRK